MGNGLVPGSAPPHLRLKRASDQTYVRCSHAGAAGRSVGRSISQPASFHASNLHRCGITVEYLGTLGQGIKRRSGIWLESGHLAAFPRCRATREIYHWLSINRRQPRMLNIDFRYPTFFIFPSTFLRCLLDDLPPGDGHDFKSWEKAGAQERNRIPSSRNKIYIYIYTYISEVVRKLSN